MMTKVFNIIGLLLLVTQCILVQAGSIPITSPRFTPEELIFDVGDLGKIGGLVKETTETKREFVAFYGIPYGNATERRFLPADDVTKPLVADGGVFDAASTMTCCPQYDTILCSMGQEENCLQLYVGTPIIPSQTSRRLPVIVFIHGGEFTSGSAIIYNGDRLIERDVVVVSLNYRIGALGFFCLNDEEAPGNTAMYDLVQALTWINQYIDYFGGDPNKVTVTGQSAGSVSVTQLLLSPMIKGDDGQVKLMQQGIAVSGTALNDWGTTTPEKAEVASLKIAQLVGCHDPEVEYDVKEVIQCMKRVEPNALVSAMGSYQSGERLAFGLGFDPVTPVIQKVAPVTGQPKFLAEDPLTIFEDGRQANIPLIMGSTRHDGSYVLGLIYNQVLNPQNLQNNATFLRTRAIPLLLHALGISDTTGAIYDLLADAYLGPDIKVSGNFSLMTPGCIDLHSVFFFKAAALKTLSLHSRIQPNSYWYSFDFNGPKSLYDFQIGMDHPVPGGVSHADDLIYIFNIPTFGLTTADEKIVSSRLVNFWANFAISGNPNIGEPAWERSAPRAEDWPMYQEEEPAYVVMDTDASMVYDLPSNHWRGLSYELMPELFPPPTESSTTTSPCQ